MDELEQVAPPVLDSRYSEDPDDPYDDAPAVPAAEPAPPSSDEVAPARLPTISASPDED